ncbi:MAG: DNRLRE domain-containing protein [Kiritimatiellae bacterium]|nr:DNRLRE domain-containing protein [Kiritimatiellia bacterium]
MCSRNVIRWFAIAGVCAAVGFPAFAARLILQQGLNGYAGSGDTWLDESATRDNYGGDSKLTVKYNSGPKSDCALVRFTLPAVSHDAVSSAILELFYVEAVSMVSGNAMGLKPYRVNAGRNWFENTRNGQSGEGASWRYFGRDEVETNKWTSEDGGWQDKTDDGNSSNLIKEAGGSVPGAIEPNHWVPFEVRRSVTNWLGGAPNNGLVVFSCSFEGSGYVVSGEFASRETNSAALRPKLSLQYQGAQIAWTGKVSGAWDTAATNWSVGGWPGQYDNGDHVRFTDATAQTNIAMAAGLTPASVTVSNVARSFAFSGGPLGGTGLVLKAGAGMLTLAASNSYGGPTLVVGGILVAASNGALGSVAAGTAVGSGAVLRLQGSVSYAAPEPLDLAGTLEGITGSNTWAGPVSLTGPATLSATPFATLHVEGSIGGAEGVVISGGGVVSIGGTGSSSYAGTTAVHSGTLNLGRGTGPAVPGALVIGGEEAATARVGWMNQLAATNPVRVREFGVLDLNSFGLFNPLGQLRWRGGAVSSGNGPMNLVTDVVAEASAESAGLAGFVSLGATDRVFQVENGVAENDMVVTAMLNAGGIHKMGAGRLWLDTNNSFESPMRIAEGEIISGADQALGLGPVFLGEGSAVAAGLYLGGNNRLTNSLEISAGDRTLGTLSGVATGAWAGPVALAGPLTLKAAAASRLVIEQGVAGAAGSVTVTGGGVVELHGAGTYTGGATVIGGTLRACSGSGSATGDGAVQIQAGGTLGGTGCVQGPVTLTVGATLDPGGSAGLLAISNRVALGDGSRFRVDADGGGYDAVDLRRGGALDLAPAAQLLVSGTLSGTDTCAIVRGATRVDGTFLGLPSGTALPPPNENWFIHYTPAGIYLGRNPNPLWYFRGWAHEGQALLSWRTPVELDVLGYDLYRDEGGAWVKVNVDPIPPGDPNGAAYVFADPAMGPGMSGRYRLVELHEGGLSNELVDCTREFTELAFTAGPRPAGGGLELRWRSREDETYWLERAADPAGDYVPVAGPLPATPGENTYTNPPDAFRGFYRAVMHP